MRYLGAKDQNKLELLSRHLKECLHRSLGEEDKGYEDKEFCKFIRPIYLYEMLLFPKEFQHSRLRDFVLDIEKYQLEKKSRDNLKDLFKTNKIFFHKLFIIFRLKS